MEPHSGKFVIAVLNHIFHSVKGIVKLYKLSLGMGVVKAIHGNQVHVIEGKVFELGIDEVILLCVSGDNVSQVESIMNHCCAIEAEAQKSDENDNHHSLGFGLKQHGGVLFPGEAREIPAEEGERHALAALLGLLHLGQEVSGGAGCGEQLGAVGIGGRSGGGENHGWRAGGNLGGGRQYGDNVLASCVALSKGLDGCSNVGAGGNSGAGVGGGGGGVLVVVVGIGELLRLDLNYSR